MRLDDPRMRLISGALVGPMSPEERKAIESVVLLFADKNGETIATMLLTALMIFEAMGEDNERGNLRDAIDATIEAGRDIVDAGTGGELVQTLTEN